MFFDLQKEKENMMEFSKKYCEGVAIICLL